MRRAMVLIAAGAVALAAGVVGFTVGRTRSVPQPVETTLPAKVAQPEVGVTGVKPSSASTLPSTSPGASALATAADKPFAPLANAAASNSTCSNPNALGVSRVVEIDTTGGPGFGFEHFKQLDFLRDKEVVLTFDDGPWPTTPAVLKALAESA